MPTLSTETIVITVTLLLVVIVELIQMARDATVQRQTLNELELIKYNLGPSIDEHLKEFWEDSIELPQTEFQKEPSPNRFLKKYLMNFLSLTNRFHIIFISIELLIITAVFLLSIPSAGIFGNISGIIKAVIYLSILLFWAVLPMITVREYEYIIGEEIYPVSLSTHIEKVFQVGLLFSFQIWMILNAESSPIFGSPFRYFGLPFRYPILFLISLLIIFRYISLHKKYMNLLDREVSEVYSRNDNI